MIDRNELEDQVLKNLDALGMGNPEHASSIARLNQLLKDDYRGIIVTMIHKFRDMPANLNTRSNIYVFIDEAHRTTGGDLGNFLMAGLPNATFLGSPAPRWIRPSMARAPSNLRRRRRQGLPEQIFHRREYRGWHDPAPLLPTRPQ